MTEQLAPTAGWCPPGGCPARQTAELEVAVALAFDLGRAYERAELAELELTTWRSVTRKTQEDKVAERMEAMRGSVPPPPLRFDDPDWPPVAVPGGGVRVGPGQLVRYPEDSPIGAAT
ncbi:hypothetical protein CSH63_29330 [Micromonospora tulbaghiae]|uniref:Uncharacterized protein n=1 Tax=Micromonospora tulbaghiae TaxID=479978 RepID=A0A386WST7_9ACTN|nr:hypothetical protein [Micromonospora tulbaghiae]AYF31477.1 hypothetical protein CSH63_29330 [Micromonospora tulbaghiae]